MTRYRTASALLCCLALLAVIIDSKTALTGAADGIELCLRTVIPSLFPFIIISIMLTGILSGNEIPFLRPVARLCGIPFGGECILLIGLLGGYPAGAQCVRQLRQSGVISHADYCRILGFCSNAGAAFIFGMSGSVFSEKWIPWIIWIIHMLSAVLTGIVLPEKKSGKASMSPSKSVTLSSAMTQSLRLLAQVCGWITLFKIILAFVHKWFLRNTPKLVAVMVSGILEMTNGCLSLSSLSCNGLKLILYSAFLSSGGISILMQTISATEGYTLGWYLPGKLLQTGFSILLATTAQLLLFPKNHHFPVFFPFVISMVMMVSGYGFLMLKTKKTVDFQRKILYTRLIKSN